MKITLLTLTLLILCSCSSNSDDVAPPEQGIIDPIIPTEPVDPPKPIEPPPVIDPGNSVDGFNTVELEYNELDTSVLNFLIQELEPQYHKSEFTIKRDSSEESYADKPSTLLDPKDIFSSYVTFYIDSFLFNMKPRVETLAPYYSVPRLLSEHSYSGLAHAELCHSTSTSLAATIKESKVPDQEVIDELNIFEKRVNLLRNKTIFDSSKEAKVELVKVWSKFMGCLAYTESLTSADTSSSYNVSKEYSPRDYNKPLGVKFYEDPYQDLASRLNIGLYQFTPNSSGNIYPCIYQWNDIYPDSNINTNEQQDNLIRIFGSSFQGMNAFCGVNKIIQTFAIQVNTDEKKRTHPDNYTIAGIEESQNRCVTPWFYASYAYNHFGPLQNSTGLNLKKLITCVNEE
ncbi:hypothetical protein [Halobacteriovorax sp. HLS]|uniref:hypothetical protein n=1 Tax=Halobacteriovorax sp. HLS TaxID=2234000 RepID=UPI000FDA9BB0|nr:hypothetical protein [Halobacteriovorax sp. HLS]